MKLFFDTEFTGLQKDTTLISIGIIADDSKIFYAEFNDYNKDQVNDWIQENIIKNFENPKFKKNGMETKMIGDKETIKKELTLWLKQFKDIELISDVCHYDMVLFIDIFGTAFDLPKHVCPVCYDINQDIARYLNISQAKAFDINREDLAYEKDDIIMDKVKHNALWDALVIRDIYNKINN